jgi:hypothetical protein
MLLAMNDCAPSPDVNVWTIALERKGTAVLGGLLLSECLLSGVFVLLPVSSETQDDRGAKQLLRQGIAVGGHSARRPKKLRPASPA